MTTRTGLIARTILVLGVAASIFGAPADARRGGSFGSRGSRTYYSPSSTRLSPGYTAPVSRSMTDRPAYGASPYAPSYQPRYAAQPRPGLFHGFGGGLLTGLVAGGLIGHFFGHGYGGGWGGSGGGGLLATLFQIALIGGGIWLAMRLFRGRSQPDSVQPAYQPSAFASAPSYAPPSQGPEIALSPSDQRDFERLLLELQDAFAREDYGRLRKITTPEVMSYLAEELSDNATHGRRNDVSGTRLLDGEVSEAWSEDGKDYATIVMRYESTDMMRDRTTGAILAGSAGAPSETTEVWTFVRPAGGYGDWKVSAIQDA